LSGSPKIAFVASTTTRSPKIAALRRLSMPQTSFGNPETLSKNGSPSCPREDDSNSNLRLRFDVTEFGVIRLMSEWNRRDQKQRRIRTRQILSPAWMLSFGPCSSARNSGRILPLEAKRVSEVRFRLSPPASSQFSTRGASRPRQCLAASRLYSIRYSSS
jgi:hypothetical protein